MVLYPHSEEEYERIYKTVQDRYRRNPSQIKAQGLEDSMRSNQGCYRDQSLQQGMKEFNLKRYLEPLLRKSGIPHETDIPAPAITTIDRLRLIISIISIISDIFVGIKNPITSSHVVRTRNECVKPMVLVFTN